MTREKYPLISVIMPVYNHENYVKQALHSILNQTYPNLEIIIIDDGSKDQSCAVIETVLKEWKDPENTKREIHFIKQENKGAHVTINSGLAMAQGAWLTILNSDDYYRLDRLSILYQQTTLSQAEISFTYVVGVDEKDQLLPTTHWWTRWYEQTRVDLFGLAPTVGFILLEHNFAVSTGNLFFSRQLYNQVGSFKNLKLAHDYDFILRALLLTEPLLIREDLYFYRIHAHNTQHQVSHLAQQERGEIYADYLCSMYQHPPKNRKAPCHWYWPTEFAKWRTKANMNQGLEKYIIKDNPPHTSSITTDVEKESGKKATLISHNMSLSGAPKLVADLALCLSKNGYSPNVIALYDGPMRQELEKNGIPVYIINRDSKLKEIRSLLYAIFFQVKGPVIVNSVMNYEFVYLLSLLRPWKKPFWYIHESFTPIGHIRGNGRRDRIMRKLLSFCNQNRPPKTWFGSDKTRQAWDYTPFPEGKVMYWSGIPSQTLRPIEKPTLKHFLSVGTVSSRKGTETLIEAFLLCLREKRIPQDSTLTIVGFPNKLANSIEPIEDIILKVITSDAKDRIHMVENLDPQNLDHYFQKTDVYIQSSVLECMPIALLTAMSKGLPIVTTNVDGCAEAVVDEQTGYLCQPYNVQSLADAMAKSITDPKQSQAMGLQAQNEFNKRFSLEVTQETIFEELRK